MPVLSRADGTNAPAASDQTTPAKPKKASLPFHGNLNAVDTNAKTLSVGTLMLQITSVTKITRTGSRPPCRMAWWRTGQWHLHQA